MRFNQDGNCQTGAIPWTLDPRYDASKVGKEVGRIAADYRGYFTRYSAQDSQRVIGDSIWQEMELKKIRELSERDYETGISALNTLLGKCQEGEMHPVQSTRDSAADCRRIVTNPFSTHHQEGSVKTFFETLGSCLYEHKEEIDMSALNGLASFHIIFQDNERVAFRNQIPAAGLKAVRDSCNTILAIYSFAIDPEHGHTQGTADWCHQMKYFMDLQDWEILSRIDAIKKVVTRTSRFPAHRSSEYSFLLSLYWLNVIRAFWPRIGACITEADLFKQEDFMAANVAFGEAFDRLINGLTTGTLIHSEKIPIVWNFIFNHSRYGFTALVIASILLNQVALKGRPVVAILMVIADPFAFTPESTRDEALLKWMEFADFVLQAQFAVDNGTVLTFHQVVDIVDVLVDSVMDSSHYPLERHNPLERHYPLERIPDTPATKTSTSFFESMRESMGF
jgi:hypothetical protein